MTIHECRREAEVVEAIVGRRWPDWASAELREHLHSCPPCQEAAAIATAFSEDLALESDRARVPSSAHVWWRSQLRARHEAVRAASRPMSVAQGFVAASAVGVSATAITWGWRSGWWADVEFRTSLWTRASELVDQLAVLTRDPSASVIVLASIAICLILMPVAVYLALAEK
jgi:hypothetical protein